MGEHHFPDFAALVERHPVLMGKRLLTRSSRPL
jgi:hypothetical protein